MKARSLGLAGLAVVTVLTGGAAYSANTPRLTGLGPATMEGTSASSTFEIGDTTVRQVRYVDRGTLRYTFVLANRAMVPMTVTGLAPLDDPPTLFTYLRITDASGHAQFTIAPLSRRKVTLSLRMTACERLSARAGSFAKEVRVHTTAVGGIEATPVATLPEEIHTGSAREASCPRSGTSSRPHG